MRRETYAQRSNHRASEIRRARAWREMTMKERFDAHEARARAKVVVEEPPRPLAALVPEVGPQQASTMVGVARAQHRRIRSLEAYKKIEAETAKMDREQLEDRLLNKTVIGALLFAGED